MQAYFQQVVYRIKGSYWFFPSIMVTAAIVLSQISIWIDRFYGSEWLKEIWFVALNQPDGARAILATVAGSMITVAGVTFSLTTLAVSHASSQFGPRLLDNFMHDRGNQITLGTFLATFIYCLMVLRVVRGEDVVADDDLAVGIFVPQLSLVLALLLTLSSVAELIYFIHHVPDSIHITSLLKRLAKDMSKKLDELYPEEIGAAHDSAKKSSTFAFTPRYLVLSKAAGYLQGIDDSELFELAKKRNFVIRLTRRPGDFIRKEELIAEVGDCDSWEEEDMDRVRYSFTIGFGRTPTQDAFYILNELVEIAVRALSPGVNDPFTAMQCIDWLSAGLVQLSNRELPCPQREDEDGQVRIMTTEITHRQFTDVILWQMVPYVKADANARRYMIASLHRTLEISDNGSLNGLILEVVVALEQDAE